MVLLTPVVFATALRLRLRPKPHVYACNHLANSASLLLPVSNLANLLALRATGLTFTRFAGLMALPWLAVIAVECLVLRRFFTIDLVAHGEVGRGHRAALPATRDGARRHPAGVRPGLGCSTCIRPGWRRLGRSLSR